MEVAGARGRSVPRRVPAPSETESVVGWSRGRGGTELARDRAEKSEGAPLRAAIDGYHDSILYTAVRSREGRFGHYLRSLVKH